MMNHEVPTQTLQFHEQVITIQSNQESEPKPSPQHALRCPPGSSRRSRQNLTEEEKEERRLSRILANRESARQTIRRRQAMYEELTRKAADLASENENLKKKRKLAAKEFDSLKNQNASLRLQISKTDKAEAEETDGASRSKPVEISITSTAPAPNPTALFNQPPLLPFFWPSIVQPFNLLQCSTQNISDIASVVPSPTAEELNSINRQQSSNPGQPFYVLPFPCLIPFHPQSNPFLPCASTVTDRHAETPSAHQCSTSYVSNQAATARETEAEAPDSIKATQPGFLHEAMLGFPPCRGASEGTRQPSGVRSREMVPTTHQQEDTRDTNAVFCTAGHVGDTSERTSQESVTCSSEETAHAIAATEARKRRKELLHLKGHH